jgi:seryl-tRNA synthetase
MLDLNFIRSNAALVRQAALNRGDSAPVDLLLEIDGRRREVIQTEEALRERRNQLGKMMADPTQRTPELIDEGRRLGDEVRALGAERGTLEQQLKELVLQIPNIPHESVPIGPDESANVEVRRLGKPHSYAFEPRPHWEIGERLRIIDFERGVKLSGSRFYHLRGAGARLQRGMITWMLDQHARNGYLEVYPPYLVKGEVMLGSGQLPKFHDNLFRDAEEDLWLIPTAEVVLVTLHSDEVLREEDLPLNYTAYTACFRREKISAGRDVRGIKRGFQFDKVELVKVVPASSSNDELERLLQHVTLLVEMLDLPYRVVQLCTGDLGFAMQKTYDIEVWSPGVGEWLEVSSCSNAGDFQARRSNIRYQPSSGGRPIHPHTLNGSGLALPRMMIAVLETYQQADGSVRIPHVLRPYVGSDVVTGDQTTSSGYSSK